MLSSNVYLHSISPIASEIAKCAWKVHRFFQLVFYRHIIFHIRSFFSNFILGYCIIDTVLLLKANNRLLSFYSSVCVFLFQFMMGFLSSFLLSGCSSPGSATLSARIISELSLRGNVKRFSRSKANTDTNPCLSSMTFQIKMLNSTAQASQNGLHILNVCCLLRLYTML